MSFTKLRNILKDPNATPEQQYAVWSQGFDEAKLGKDWILHLMDITRKGMGVQPQKPAVQQPAPQPVAEQRLFNSLVRPQQTLVFENAPTSQMVRDLINPQGREAQKYANFDKARDQRRDKMEKGALAARNSRQYSSSKDDWGNLKQEEFDSEYDDEAGMAQSNLRTMARAVDGLLKTIKNNDNLPEWGQEKIAKAEMMLVSVWDYLQSQKELGRDPKVSESRALTGLKQIVAELSNEKLGQYKKAAGAQASAADKAGDTKKADKRFSGIVKATKKQFANDEKGVAEGAPIVVMPRADRLKKAEPTKVRYQGDIVPPTKPPSTEKRGVKGRPGQRPMPDQSVEEKMLPKSAFAGSDKNKLGSAGQLKGSMKRPARAGDLVGSAEESIENEAKQRLDPSCWKGYRKQGTKMKGDTRVNNCVKVSEDVENIMASLIEQIINK
jgi:hypothetical protein